MDGSNEKFHLGSKKKMSKLKKGVEVDYSDGHWIKDVKLNSSDEEVHYYVKIKNEDGCLFVHSKEEIEE